MKNRIRIARGTQEEITTSTAKAEKGVPFYDITNKRLYISDDPNKELKNYTPNDSIVAYNAENALNSQNSIEAQNSEKLYIQRIYNNEEHYTWTGGTVIANIPYTLVQGNSLKIGGVTYNSVGTKITSSVNLSSDATLDANDSIYIDLPNATNTKIVSSVPTTIDNNTLYFVVL